MKNNVIKIMKCTAHDICYIRNLLGRGLHWMNGSPVKSLAQMHIGV